MEMCNFPHPCLLETEPDWDVIRAMLANKNEETATAGKQKLEEDDALEEVSIIDVYNSQCSIAAKLRD